MIFSFRFLYGLRTVAPFVIGTSSVSAKKFIVLNAAGAFVWELVVGSGGYLFGRALELAIGKIKHYEVEVFALVALFGLLIWALHFYRRRTFTK
jgi:membrane protein DedA with SNARE-associated domain